MGTVHSNYQATVKLYYGDNKENGSYIGGVVINLHRLCHFQKYNGKVERWDDQKKQEFVQTASNVIIFLKKWLPLVLLVLGIALLIAYGSAGGSWSEGILTLLKATGVCSILGAFFSFCHFQRQIYVGKSDIETAYDTLGVEQNTQDRELLKRAYYKLMRRFHPDRYHGEDATEKTQQITTAYNTINTYLDRAGVSA